MIEIGDTLVADDLLDKHFVCDLNSCKGACCVEGDSGAPLEDEECAILEDIYDRVQPYMTSEGKRVVEETGVFTIDNDGDKGTPLIDNRACAFVFIDEKGHNKCAIEKAYLKSEISFRKPISCHLFPVRLKQYSTFTAVNVQLLEICDCACDLGASLKVPVYKFLEEPLVKRFGKEWYEALEALDKAGLIG